MRQGQITIFKAVTDYLWKIYGKEHEKMDENLNTPLMNFLIMLADKGAFISADNGGATKASSKTKIDAEDLANWVRRRLKDSRAGLKSNMTDEQVDRILNEMVAETSGHEPEQAPNPQHKKYTIHDIKRAEFKAVARVFVALNLDKCCLDKNKNVVIKNTYDAINNHSYSIWGSEKPLLEERIGKEIIRELKKEMESKKKEKK